MKKPNIAFFGTGIMGYQQAKRLLHAGYPVTAWNRTRAKAQRLEADGGRAAEKPAEAAKDADIAILMLADGPTSDAVLFEEGVAEAMKRGSIIVNMASIPVETAKEEARRAAEMGLRFIDAPVSGGEKGATEGTLAIMAGGEPADFEEVRPVLEVMGRPKLVGPAGAGSLAKLCNQLIVGNTITTVAEAMLLAKRGGVDPNAVRAALAGGFADSPILRLHGERMTGGNFTPGGRSTLQLKDLRTARALARSLELDLPILEQVTELYEDFVEKHGGAEKDHAGIYLELARRNGIKA